MRTLCPVTPSGFLAGLAAGSCIAALCGAIGFAAGRSSRPPLLALPAPAVAAPVVVLPDDAPADFETPAFSRVRSRAESYFRDPGDFWRACCNSAAELSVDGHAVRPEMILAGAYVAMRDLGVVPRHDQDGDVYLKAYEAGRRSGLDHGGAVDRVIALRRGGGGDDAPR